MTSSPGIRTLHALPPDERRRCLQHIVAVLARDPTVVFAYVFGSFVEDRPFEDIDVAVFVEPPPGARLDSLAVQLDLSARLETAVGLPVEVVVLNTAPLGVRRAALRGQLLWSRDDARRIALLEGTSHELMDMAFLGREALQDLLGIRPVHSEPSR
ncbi:MAG: nucleotidyltransferase domain-containing protein [Armatimonadota bacterium]|nr:nucleotidyltransferase domain-containing protein [Armatimonadota bacterium]